MTQKVTETSSRIASKMRKCMVYNEHTWGVSSRVKLAWLQVLCLFVKISQTNSSFSSASPLILHPSCPAQRITLCTLSETQNNQESPLSLCRRAPSFFAILLSLKTSPLESKISPGRSEPESSFLPFFVASVQIFPLQAWTESLASKIQYTQILTYQ